MARLGSPELKLKVIGYGRVSTADQGEEGHGLGAQRQAVEAYCKTRGWQMSWHQDIASGKNVSARPGLVGALTVLEAGMAGALVVAKLDRATRSVKDFAELLESAQAGKWALVALDLQIDTTTPTGEMIAHVMAALAQWERRLIGQRTKEGLAEAKRSGVKLGRRDFYTPPEALRLIHTLRKERHTYAQIAARLNEEGIPSPGKARWTINSVWRTLNPKERAA